MSSVPAPSAGQTHINFEFAGVRLFARKGCGIPALQVNWTRHAVSLQNYFFIRFED
jgi:hypothetical protein